MWARGNRKQEGATGGFSPLASPRGLKEAVGVTVLVESMKLREAQKMPERTLLSSFQDLSTLDGETNPLIVPGLPLLPPQSPQLAATPLGWPVDGAGTPSLPLLRCFLLTVLGTPLHSHRSLLR